MKKEERALEFSIISAINEKKPESVDQLVKLITAKGFYEEEIVKEISKLEKLGKLILESDNLKAGASKRCLFSSSTFWYWGVMVFCLLAIISVLAIPSDWFPFVYIRWVFGLGFLLYIPGFCLVMSLFPEKGIVNIEVAVLSVCFSLILILLVGLFWNFTPLGLSNVLITVTLTTLSAILATAAILRRTNVE